MTKTKKSGENNPEKNTQIVYASIGNNSYICIIMAIPKNKDVECKIYKLMNPVTREIRYIGKTIKPLNYRLYHHVYDSYRIKSHNAHWIQSLIKQELRPIIEEIETVSWHESADREIYWIKYFKELGYNLCNLTDGGEGMMGSKRSKEAIDKTKLGIMKKVYCYDTNFNLIHEFESVRNAAKHLNVHDSAIQRCLSGERRHCHRFIFSRNKIVNLPKEPFKVKTKVLRVLQYNLDGEFIKEFKTIKEASLEANVSIPAIHRAANNLITRKYKYIWQIERA